MSKKRKISVSLPLTVTHEQLIQSVMSKFPKMKREEAIKLIDKAHVKVDTRKK